MKRAFTIGVTWTAAASAIEQAASAVIFLVIARFVGVEEFGIASMTFAFLFLGEFLVRDTITEAIIERKVLEDGRLEATFVVLVAFSLLIVGVLCGAAHVVAALYGQPRVAPLLMAASPTVLVLGIGGVSTALLRRNLAYRTLAIRSIVGIACGGIVGVTMAMSGFGAWSLVGLRIVELGINSAIAIQAGRWLPRRWPSRSDFSLLRGLGPKVVMLRSITLIIHQTPTVALGIFAEPRAAGLFAIAWRFTEIVRFIIISPIVGVAQSALAEIRRRQMSTVPFFRDVSEVSALGAFTAFVGLAVIADPVVSVLLGPEWRSAGAMLPYLCLAAAVVALTSIQQAYLLALNRPNSFMVAATIEAIVGAILLGAVSANGPETAAAAVAVRALVCFPFYTKAVLSPERMSPGQFIGALLVPLVVAACILVAVGLLRLSLRGHVPDPFFLIIAIGAGFAVAGLVIAKGTPGLLSRLRTFLRD